MPRLSAIIVTHRGGELLRRCVAALRPQLRAGDELRVAISAAPGQAEVDVDASERVELGENVGFARAANAGLNAASGELLLLLNDDTEAQPGFIEALRAAADVPGMYQPRILLADGSGRLDNAGHGLFPDGFNWARGREDQDQGRYDQPGDVGACSGAAVLITRSVLDAIGAFDEDLEAFGEDVDLSLRARRYGFPLRYVPDARIAHALGATYGRYTARKVYLVERNRVRVAARSLPMSAVLTMPAWTTARVLALSAGAAMGRGWGARVGSEAAFAALHGMAAGAWHLPDALRKRRGDSGAWSLGERAMWRHLLENRVRARDVLR